MGLKRFFWIAPTTVLLIVSQSFRLNFPVPFATSPVVAQTSDARKTEADRMLQQGNQQLESSQFEAAIQSFQQALAIYREIGARKNEGNALVNLGRAYDVLEDYVKALEYWQLALALSQEIKDRQLEEQILETLASFYTDGGNHAKAIEYYHLSLSLARETKDRQLEGQILKNLASLYSEQPDYAKAIEYYHLSLSLGRETKNRQLEGQILKNLAGLYVGLNNTKVIEYYHLSLSLARETKDRQLEEQVLGNLASFYGHQERDYPKAIEYYQQRLALARETKDRHLEGQILGNLGLFYKHQERDYAKAIEYYQQRLALAREINDLEGKWLSLFQLESLYRKLGDYAKAAEYERKFLVIQQQVLATAQENKDPWERRQVRRRGANFLATSFDSKDYGKLVASHEQLLTSARERKDHQAEILVLQSLIMYSLFHGEYAKVIEYYQQRLALAREIKDPQNEGDVLDGLGNILYETGKLAEAEKVLYDAIQVWESIRAGLGNDDTSKVSIFENQARTYRSLQKVLVARNKPNEALEISERGRARAFVELLINRLSTNNKDGFTLPIEPTVNKPTIQLLQQIAKQQKATLVEYSIIDDKVKINDSLETHKSELFIWVIQPTGEVTFRRSDLKPLWQQKNISLKDLVTTTRNSIGVNDRSIFFIAEVQYPVNEEEQTKSLQQLYQLLIAPIADLLPTDSNQRVIFVPQDELFLVPFAALQDEQGKYLIEKHTILTAPSIQVLELTRQQREKVKQAATKDALVLGNPTMPNVPPEYGEKPQQLASLPGAKREAESIAPVLNTKALTGNEATKAAVLARLPQARIIHLATHGLFDDIQGLQSAIALAPTDTDNGLLTASEILDLKLNAELVVLSACNTGRGRLTGDGVIGLSRSLFIAGTPSVIVSLWAVPDAATQELISEFYRQFKLTGDKAQSLRQAMLQMKDKHPDAPRKWAAFTLIGEAE